MSEGDKGQDQGTAAVYEALNASYRAWDEYLRESQRIAEQVWGPMLRPLSGGASPFIPPEQWIRACGDIAMVWMTVAQSWTTEAAKWTGAGGWPGAPVSDSNGPAETETSGPDSAS